MAEYGFIVVLAFIFFVVRQMGSKSNSDLIKKNNQRDSIRDVNFDNFNRSHDQNRTLSKSEHPTRSENLKSNDNEHSGN